MQEEAGQRMRNANCTCGRTVWFIGSDEKPVPRCHVCASHQEKQKKVKEKTRLAS